jgi:hypothetical protein
VGFGIAMYLALYQWEVFARVWEPFFGEGSRVILTSSISRLFRLPAGCGCRPHRRSPALAHHRAPQSSNRAPFRPLIAQWLVRAPGLRATRIYRDLRTHDGFSGSYPIVQRLVRRLRPLHPVAAHVRFETAAGHQAHVDWS